MGRENSPARRNTNPPRHFATLLEKRDSMNHLGTITLETERLLLRRFTIDDAPQMFQNWAGDTAVTEFLTWPTHTSVKMSEEYITFLLDRYPRPSTYDWAITLKDEGRLVGSIGVVDIKEATECVHVGYCIGKQWWNRGITSEAFARVIRFLMDEVKVNRIDSRHDPKNPNSGRVMKKCGLRYEGTLRESDINNKGLCDADWYGLLRREYLTKTEG